MHEFLRHAAGCKWSNPSRFMTCLNVKLSKRRRKNFKMSSSALAALQVISPDDVTNQIHRRKMCDDLKEVLVTRVLRIPVEASAG